MDLNQFPKLFVKQKFEGFELLGYETRNKYTILDEQGEQVAFAAEQQKTAQTGRMILVHMSLHQL